MAGLLCSQKMQTQGLSMAGSQLSLCRSVARPMFIRTPVQMAQKLQGKVVSTSMQKTVVIEVNNMQPHPRYGKRIRTTKKYKVHDDKEICRIGDYVEVDPSAPISKTKRFTVSQILRKSEF